MLFFVMIGVLIVFVGVSDVRVIDCMFVGVLFVVVFVCVLLFVLLMFLFMVCDMIGRKNNVIFVVMM